MVAFFACVFVDTKALEFALLHVCYGTSFTNKCHISGYFLCINIYTVFTDTINFFCNYYEFIVYPVFDF